MYLIVTFTTEGIKLKRNNKVNLNATPKSKMLLDTAASNKLKQNCLDS